MYTQNLTFQKSFWKENDNMEKYLVWFFLILYTGVNLFFGLNEDATWDDDCPTRYYNTQNAFKDPSQFVSVWNRPLFVLVFSPIVHLGRHSIFISMVLMTAIGAYFLYKGIRKMGIPNAFMIIPFLLFQTYFFSISRNAETEPISVTLLCLGVFFLTHKKWLGFAIVGGLVPLARLELSVLLVFWAYYLIKERKYYYLLILGAPTLLWNIAGLIIEGDAMYVINKTVGKENKENRYGHTTFGHYFQRYIYVIGPVIYAFFFAGLVQRVRRFKWDMFIMLQLVAGFFLYVIFSWKLNMGNAAGFLRNLIPLTPLVAIVALEGYNYIWETFGGKIEIKQSESKEINLPPKPFNEVTPDVLHAMSDKKKKAYLEKVGAWEKEVAKAKKAQGISDGTNGNIGNWVWLTITIVLLILTTYVFHSFQILSHHKLTEVKDMTNWYSMLLTVAGIFLLLVLIKLLGNNKAYYSFGIILGIGMLVFTGITEPPNNNTSPERQAMEQVSDIYIGSYLKDNVTFVNHIWFFWANDLPKYDTIHFKKVTIENLEQAHIGNVCIYESHYSHRLEGNVPNTWFNEKKDWLELTRVISSDGRFYSTIHQKCDTTYEDGLAKHQAFLKAYPNDYYAIFGKANFFKKYNQLDSALACFNKCIEMNDTIFNFYFSRGLTYFGQKNYDSALVDFKKSSELNPKSHDAIHNQAACYSNLQLPDSAIAYYKKTILLKPDFAMAYLNVARSLKQKGLVDEAMEYLNSAISMNLKNEPAILERAQIFYEKQEWQKSIDDLNNAININPKNPNAYLVRGVCYMNLKNQAMACQDWQNSAALGNPQGLAYFQQFCGGVPSQ